MPLHIAQACDRAVQYLLGRQCANGGFCFYRSEHLEEPNLADTYHAAAALRMLGRAVPRAADVAMFVDRFPLTVQPTDLYFVTGTRRVIDPSFRPDERIVRAVRHLSVPGPPSQSRITGWLQRTRLVTRLKRDFDKLADAPGVRGILEQAIDGGGFGSRPNVHDTWLAVEILDACGDAKALPAVGAFIDQLQCEPFGFTDTAVGTNANVDVIFAGVRSCVLLGLPIRYPELAARFMLQCQTGSGGFARAPSALASIEYTYEAVAALLVLSEGPGQRTFARGTSAV